ncbi:MAG: ferrous iron transport protein B [Thermoplasmata archaeon]|nr:MAG: ferrous iron transport protein B [Thermoplasmata archaeon]
MKKCVVALAGNPNVGKTALFNALTGARHHVGNWPGVTVEKRVGWFRYRGVKYEVVDLPGTYSLGSYSLDERIARDYILSGEAAVVVDVVDSTNLHRNLYLTLQLLEMGANVVVALNMMDEAEQKGLKIDIKRLSSLLRVPVVPTVAVEGRGIEDLKCAIYEEMTQHPRHHHMTVGYGRAVEVMIARVVDVLRSHPQLEKYSLRWLAVRALEGDKDILKIIEDAVGEESAKKIKDIQKDLRNVLDDPVIFFADKRYELIEDIVGESITGGREEWSYTDLLDRVTSHPIFGLLMFFALMWAVFEFTFRVAEPFVDAIDFLFSQLASFATRNISNAALSSLISDGIINGVGSVLIFTPNIFLIFLALSLLEDSGYMARAAFVMDRAMYRIGLPGKAFIPMLVGFGCNVPAIMATRTIEDEKDRLVTILIAPLMSCSARLPVYILFAGIFFAGREGSVILSMYLLGILLAVVTTLFLRRFVVKGKPSPLILEMPPYRLPSLKAVLLNTWERGSAFVKRAGTIIFAGVVVVWFLSTYPGGPGSDINHTYLAYIGRVAEPLFRPMGWDWRLVVALLLGFLAKEIVVGALGTLYSPSGGEEATLRSSLQSTFTPLQAYSFMAFVLIYVPCLATLATIRAETRSWKWTAFATVYLVALAYAVALLITAVGSLLGRWMT